MKVLIEETATKQLVEAEILPATKLGMPLKKDGWQFNWRELARENKEALFFKLVKEEAPFQIEGMLMLSLRLNKEMVEMSNIENAPYNIGKNKKYDWVTGCLLAYACLLGFQIGKNNYKGFVSFESKTALMEHYHKVYGAKYALG